MRSIAVNEELLGEASEWPSRLGQDALDRFVISAADEKILQAKREAFAKSSESIRRRMEELGITEEEILADFERFRTELYRDEKTLVRIVESGKA